MSNWGEPQGSKFARLMVYSMPGWGKTTSELSMPQPVRVLDAENSTLALAGLKYDRDVKVRNVEKFMDCQMALQELKDEGVGGGSIVFDTLTQIQRKHIRELAGASVPSRKDYYSDTYGLGRMYSAFANLPMHVFYFCGLDTVDVGEGDNKSKIQVPDLTPSLMKDLLQICDAVGLAFLDVQGNRCLTFDSGRTHFAKRRHVALPKGVILANKPVEGVGKIIDWEELLSRISPALPSPK